MATQVETMPTGGHVTANDRLKGSFNTWFWGSIAAAALIHFLVIAFWPSMTAEDYGIVGNEMEALEIPPEVEIPPPPEQIVRPQVPVISTDITIDEDITIAETDFESNPISDLPPPPSGGGADLSDAPAFTPYTVSPEVRNRRELERILQRNYPAMLRDAGISGTVMLHVFINEEGIVENTRLMESSGYPQMDQAAENAMREIRFTPALNRDQRVPVWVALPVTFRVD